MVTEHEKPQNGEGLAFAELIGVQGATAIIVQHLKQTFNVLRNCSLGATWRCFVKVLKWII